MTMSNDRNRIPPEQMYGRPDLHSSMKLDMPIYRDNSGYYSTGPHIAGVETEKGSYAQGQGVQGAPSGVGSLDLPNWFVGGVLALVGLHLLGNIQSKPKR